MPIRSTPASGRRPPSLPRLFSGSETLLAEELAGRTYAEDMKARGSSLGKEIALTLGFALISFARPKSFAARAHRWLWYAGPTASRSRSSG